jgi:hypothetical protein
MSDQKTELRNVDAVWPPQGVLAMCARPACGVAAGMTGFCEECLNVFVRWFVRELKTSDAVSFKGAGWFIRQTGCSISLDQAKLLKTAVLYGLNPVTAVNELPSAMVRSLVGSGVDLNLRDFQRGGVRDEPSNRSRRSEVMSALPNRVNAGVVDIPDAPPQVASIPSPDLARAETPISFPRKSSVALVWALVLGLVLVLGYAANH